MRSRPVRVIPVLLLHEGGLYKSVGFRDLKYIGDPINAVRVFNDKEVDELIVLDIDATPFGREPQWELLEEMAGEAFMPLCYGGGLKTMDDFDRAFAVGLEKVAVNTAGLYDVSLVEQAATKFGRQSVVACIDARRHRRSWEVFASGGRDRVKGEPAEIARRYAEAGAGELIVQSIDRDGTGSGYDLDLVREVTTAVSVPVIALGGAGSVDHFRDALRVGAAGVAAGSYFVFHGKRRAVLISYLVETERSSLA